jgi:L-alanine-DL-glutamate epimerase-like enolase superfamily enzyme
MGSRCAIDQQAELFRATIVGARIHHPFTLGGLNEVMIVLLLAAKFGVPVFPHAAASGCANTSSTSPCSTIFACPLR